MLNKQFFILIVLLLSFAQAFGQKGTKNPYSVLGLGELQTDGYASYATMGGVSMASMDSAIVNFSNPATYAGLDRQLPVFQVGFNGKFSQFSTDSLSSNEQYFSLNQFQLGIPIKKNWGFAMGFQPYAYRGYNVASYEVSDGDTISQKVNEGSGALSTAFFGLGYRPINFSKSDTIEIKNDSTDATKLIKRVKNHKLYVGVNGNYYFGTVVQKRSYEQFPIGYSNFDPYNARVENSLRLSDLNVDFGLNYTFTSTTSAKSRSLSVGIGYQPGMEIRAYQDLISYTYQGSFYEGAIIAISDTVENISNNEGSVYMPETYKFGFEYRNNPSYGSPSSFRIGVDARYQAWSKYQENFDTGEQFTQMNDRISIGVGLEYTPFANFYDADGFLQKVRYRFGLNYTLLEYSILNNSNTYQQIGNYGMSFGFGIPIPGTNRMRSNTNLNFGASFGMAGTTENGLIQERYSGVYLGISITPGYSDAWFRKRLYN